MVCVICILGVSSPSVRDGMRFARGEGGGFFPRVRKKKNEGQSLSCCQQFLVIRFRGITQSRKLN